MFEVISFIVWTIINNNSKHSGKWIIIDLTDTISLMCTLLALFYLFFHCAVYFHLNFWLLKLISFFVFFKEQSRQPICFKVKQDINTPKDVNKRLTKRWIYAHWLFCKSWKHWCHQCIVCPLVGYFKSLSQTNRY